MVVVGSEALIGNGATVQDGARIGERSLIGAGSLVPPGAVIPDDVMALVRRPRPGPLSDAAAGWVHGNPSIYQELVWRHAAGLRTSARGARETRVHRGRAQDGIAAAVDHSTTVPIGAI